MKKLNPEELAKKVREGFGNLPLWEERNFPFRVKVLPEATRTRLEPEFVFTLPGILTGMSLSVFGDEHNCWRIFEHALFFVYKTTGEERVVRWEKRPYQFSYPFSIHHASEDLFSPIAFETDTVLDIDVKYEKPLHNIVGQDCVRFLLDLRAIVRVKPEPKEPNH